MSSAGSLAIAYEHSLRSYLDGRDEEALTEAYAVGRSALEAGIGPLVLFSMHRDIVETLPPRNIEPHELVSRVTTVFIEALAPYQMAYATFDEARAAVQELEGVLERHAVDIERAERHLESVRELRSMLESHSAELRRVRSRLDQANTQAMSRRHLVGDIVQAQEQERRRIAGDIHDDSVQAMTVVLLRLGMLRHRLRGTDDLPLVDQLERSVADSIARLRRLIYDLRPTELDEAGLGSMLISSLTQLRSETGLEFGVEDRINGKLGPEARIIAYRILQEAFVNVRKHARAGRIDVTLVSKDGGLLVTVADDGQGFDIGTALQAVRPGHLGLGVMRERAELAAGWLEISSRPAGTTVEFWLPDREPE